MQLISRLIASLILVLFTPVVLSQPGSGPGYQCPGCDVEYPHAQVPAVCNKPKRVDSGCGPSHAPNCISAARCIGRQS